MGTVAVAGKRPAPCLGTPTREHMDLLSSAVT